MQLFRTMIDRESLRKRHESPVSVWWLVLMYPVFVLAIYRRSRALSGVLLLSLATNLFVVSPPDTDDAWATRVVRGEQVWLDRGVLSSKRDLTVTAVGGLVNLYTLRAALHRRPVKTMVGTVASMVVMFLFFDRMVKLYDSTRDQQAESTTSQ